MSMDVDAAVLQAGMVESGECDITADMQYSHMAGTLKKLVVLQLRQGLWADEGNREAARYRHYLLLEGC